MALDLGLLGQGNLAKLWSWTLLVFGCGRDQAIRDVLDFASSRSLWKEK